MIHDIVTAASHAVALAARPDIDSICVHGDTPDSVALARSVRAALIASGFAVRSFS